MSITGQFRSLDIKLEAQPISDMLAHGLELAENLGRKLHNLDDLMLTGRPNEISDAAAAVEWALKDASPTFAEIAETVSRLGASNLMTAAEQLRRIQEEDAAGLAEALRGALARFAKRSFSANKRAQQFNRGLSAALQSLQALGMQEGGRLIAEA
ncbi:hypothetical protein [Acidocella aromatica]|uniref:Uncharacterized protein n=1 Tax=Acidocella aromatica TaxID=1303579 RepID=A0A840VD35_9PROT|nr:hypothetical protein [Acidocella aromatica]MBB5373763.1 hypothetical protein [Acidocella aromatica]